MSHFDAFILEVDMAYIRRTEPQHEPGEVIEMMVRSTADPSEMGQPSSSTDEPHLIEIAGKRVLVDPMLSAKGAMAPIENSPNPQPNPLTELPLPLGEALRDVE